MTQPNKPGIKVSDVTGPRFLPSRQREMGIVAKVLVLALITVLVVGLVWVIAIDPQRFAAHIASIINSAWFIGIVGGMLGAAILTVLLGFQWKSDVKCLHKSVDRQKTLLQSLVEAVHHMDRRHVRLHEALGKEFTASVLGFHPATSKGVAQVIGGIVDRVYLPRWNKVAVVEACDCYTIMCRRNLELKAGSVDVWEVKFVSYWRWYNDSEGTQIPLKNFIIGIAPTYHVLQKTKDAATEQPQWTHYRRLIEQIYPNYVMTNVANPNDSETKPDPMDFEKLFIIDSLSMWNISQGKVVARHPRIRTTDPGDGSSANAAEYLELIRVSPLKEEWGLHAAWQLPSELEERFSLDEGGEMKVWFEGTMFLPVHLLPDGSVGGALEYNPSDLVIGRGDWDSACEVIRRRQTAGDGVKRARSIPIGDDRGFSVAVGVPNGLGAPRVKLSALYVDSFLERKQISKKSLGVPQAVSEYAPVGTNYKYFYTLDETASLSELDRVHLSWRQIDADGDSNE